MGRRTHRRDVVAFEFIPFEVAVPKDRCPVTGKVRFTDPVDAALALANIEAKDSPHRSKMEQRQYPCLFCEGIHLTSEDQKTPLRR